MIIVYFFHLCNYHKKWEFLPRTKNYKFLDLVVTRVREIKTSIALGYLSVTIMLIYDLLGETSSYIQIAGMLRKITS